MAAMVVYQERQNHGSDDHTRDPAEEQLARRPISASEVDEASNLVFRRSSTPSEYVFNPNPISTEQPGNTSMYPRLRRNQTVGNEVLAMGHRLARHPGVQAIIMDDLMAQHNHDSAAGPRARGGRDALPSTPGRETGFARLVDILDEEGEVLEIQQRSGGESNRRDRGRRYLIGGTSDSESNGFRDFELNPNVSQEWQEVLEAAGEPWSLEHSNEAGEEEMKDTESPKCSCRACNGSLVDDAVANSGTCWKEVQADFECQICFDVLVGVHVLDNCGHHFCGCCMERWMGNALQGECPVCRAPVNKLVPVLKMDEMIAKAVAAAAPGKERSAWYERRAAWERTARRRRESMERARVATEAASDRVAAAQAAAAAAEAERDQAEHAYVDTPGIRGRPGVQGSTRREQPERGRQERDGRDEEGEGDTPRVFRMSKLQAVLAVAVLLVITVLKIRRGR